MISIKQMASMYETALNALVSSEGWTFKIYSQTGRLKPPEKDGNTVSGYVPAQLSVSSSALEANQVLVMGVNYLTLDFLIPEEPLQVSIYQDENPNSLYTVDDDGQNYFVNHVTEIINGYFQTSKAYTADDDDGNTFSIGQKASIATSGLVMAETPIGRAVPVTVRIELSFVEGGTNALDIVLYVDNEQIPYQSLVPSRSAQLETNVYSGNTKQTHLVSSDVFGLEVTFPSTDNEAVKTLISEFITGDTINVAHFTHLVWGDMVDKYYLMTVTSMNSSAQGSSFAGIQMSLGEVSGDSMLINIPASYDYKTISFDESNAGVANITLSKLVNTDGGNVYDLTTYTVLMYVCGEVVKVNLAYSYSSDTYYYYTGKASVTIDESDYIYAGDDAEDDDGKYNVICILSESGYDVAITIAATADTSTSTDGVKVTVITGTELVDETSDSGSAQYYTGTAEYTVTGKVTSLEILSTDAYSVSSYYYIYDEETGISTIYITVLGDDSQTSYDVYITYTYEGAHTIYATSSSASCTIDIEDNSAYNEDTVTFTLNYSEDDGTVTSCTVTDIYGEEVELTYDEDSGEYSFTMPNSDVYIYVEFESAVDEYNITYGFGYQADDVVDGAVQFSYSGSFSDNPASAQEGTEITFSVSLTGAEAIFPIITDADGTRLSYTLVSYPSDTSTDTLKYSYSFTMPASDVSVKLYIREHTKKSVAYYFAGSTSIASAAWTTQPTSAYSYSTVKFVFSYDSAAVTPSVSVKDSDSCTVSCKGSSGSYSFTMPTSAVKVTATFTARSYTISPASTNNSNISASTVTAQVGDSVTYTVTVTGGTISGTPTFSNVSSYTSSSSTSGDVTTYKYTFTMPAANVTFSATYVENSLTVTTVQSGATAVGYTANASTTVSGATVTYTVTITDGCLTGTPTAYVGDVSDGNTITLSGGFSSSTASSSGTTNTYVYTFTMPSSDVTIYITTAANSTSETLATYSYTKTVSITTGTSTTVTLDDGTEVTDGTTTFEAPGTVTGATVTGYTNANQVDISYSGTTITVTAYATGMTTKCSITVKYTYVCYKRTVTVITGTTLEDETSDSGSAQSYTGTGSFTIDGTVTSAILVPVTAKDASSCYYNGKVIYVTVFGDNAQTRYTATIYYTYS